MTSLREIVRFAAATATLVVVALSPVAGEAAQVFVEGRNDGDYPRAGVPIVLASMEIVMASFETPRSELNAVANLTDESVVKVEVVDTRPLANAEAIAWAEAENAAGVETAPRGHREERALQGAARRRGRGGGLGDGRRLRDQRRPDPLRRELRPHS